MPHDEKSQEQRKESPAPEKKQYEKPMLEKKGNVKAAVGLSA